MKVAGAFAFSPLPFAIINGLGQLFVYSMADFVVSFSLSLHSFILLLLPLLLPHSLDLYTFRRYSIDVLL